MQALKRDKRCIPTDLKNALSVDRLFTDWNVQYAIEEMASHKAAGDDGMPADWYKTVGARRMEKAANDDGSETMEEQPSPLAILMARAFKQIHAGRGQGT